jgi:diacylglycerol kinase (ATP)
VQIGLINNLRAGRSDRLVSRMLGVLRDFPEVHHVETNQAGALPEAIAELARRQADVVIVNGGDGTLQHALTEILGGDDFARVPFVAPLRGGRTNMAAKDLGATRDPVKGMRAVAEAARAGRLHERFVHRPVLRVSFDRGRRVQYGMFFGVGMIHRAIALVHNVFPQGRTQGSLGAGLVTTALVAKSVLQPRDGILQPDKLDLRIDGEALHAGEYRLAIASTLRRLFWNLDPFWAKGGGDVRTSFLKSNAKHLAFAAPTGLWGRAPSFVTPENGYHSHNADRVEMRLSCGVTVDGEIYPPRPDEVFTLTADRRVTFVRA